MGAGTFRSEPETQKHTNVHEGINMTYTVSHMCGWRRFMEDTHLARSPLSDGKNSLFAVFDGHGEQLQTNQSYKKGDYESALRETFFKMDELMLSQKGKIQIREIQKEQNQNGNGALPTESQAGCTANVWLITPSQIYVANAGDSRGVLQINKKCHQTSKDHKPDDKPEFQRITKAGGQVSMGRVNGNINLSRALGDFEFKQNKELPPAQQIITANPDIRKIKNEDIDFAIIGCDGIWEEKSCEEMVKWVADRIDRKPLDKVLEELFDELIAEERTMQAHGTDNMSAILIKFNKNVKQISNDQIRNSDEIQNLMQKYILPKDRNTQHKQRKPKGNDEIDKLVRFKYLD